MTTKNDRTLTVASYNICHGHYADFDWARIAESIGGADLVGIQEVDVHTNRSHGQDEVAALQAALGFAHALFVPAMDYDGGQYGTAILSRYPILRAERHPLDAPGHEPRAFGAVTVVLDDGQEVTFLNTHLSYESDTLIRAQMQALADYIGTLPDSASIVLTGDFNTEDFTAFAPLTAVGLALSNHARHRLPTFRKTRVAIDNVVYDPTRFALRSVEMIDSDGSDHDPLMARFDCR